MAEKETVQEDGGEVAGAIGEVANAIDERMVTRNAELAESIGAAIGGALAPIVERMAPPAADDDDGEAQRDYRTIAGIDPTDTQRDYYDQVWGDDPEMVRAAPERRRNLMRANFELARLMMGASGVARGTSRFDPSDDFLAAYRAHVLESPYMAAPKVRTSGADLSAPERVRAMDTAESGFGADLIGTAYESEMWMAARNRDPLVNLVQSVEIRQNQQVIPIDGALPEMLLVGESTTSGATAYTTSKTASSKVTQTTKKFTIQSIWSGELGEDSVVPFIPFLRSQLAESAALHLGSAYYNGDLTNAATGNINRDDADPADTKHYLAWDGMRHYYLVDNTGSGIDAAGAAVQMADIFKARGKLNGAGNDVDAAVGNINWGANADDLLLICTFDDFMKLQNFDEVITVEKYGPNATVISGELGRLGGMRVISPSYASKTEADGKASDTATNNTLGQIGIVNTRGWLGGVRRGIEFHLDRIQGTDQFLLEMYTRRSLNRFGANVASGIYNISVA